MQNEQVDANLIVENVMERSLAVIWDEFLVRGSSFTFDIGMDFQNWIFEELKVLNNAVSMMNFGYFQTKREKFPLFLQKFELTKFKSLQFFSYLMRFIVK